MSKQKESGMSSKAKQLLRCPWPSDDALMIAYHDQEWGTPVRDGQALFAKLTLDGFQAGLSWRTILHKREAFLEAFDQFDPARLVNYKEKQVQRLLGNAGIIRHRGKIESAISNAKSFLEIEESEGAGGFSKLLWGFVGGKPIVNRFKKSGEVPAETKESEAMSKELRHRGMRFVGPTICYAFMQAVGMVDDHLITCFRKSGK